MKSSPDSQAAEAEWQTIVADKVRSLRFGVVQVVVHEGKVTQIESTEKTRLESRPSSSKGR
ncbi:MAG: YezD family protein [Opitutales bacterium]|nr:YezD family protein [Opitutales bacterium]